MQEGITAYLERRERTSPANDADPRERSGRLDPATSVFSPRGIRMEGDSLKRGP
jgi:hypothetical protein